MAVADLEAAARTALANAALVNRLTDDRADQALHRQTDSGLLSCERRERTADPADHKPSILLVTIRPRVVSRSCCGIGPIVREPQSPVPFWTARSLISS